jgi:hypothetical protein
MSKWQAEKAERNRQSLARLNRALPCIFPSVVLSWVLGRPFVPPTPRLAVDSYRRAHPIRADRLGRLSYWGLPNLQVINRDVHAAKCAIEARTRRAARLLEAELN